jgi:hypothetical protein
VRSGRRHFTYSKVMAWVAFDRAIKSAEEYRLDGPLDRWRTLRMEIHADVCRKGFDPQQQSFVQSYDSKELDASLLLLPVVGFLPPRDPRVIGTIEAIERRLMVGGFVQRYDTSRSDDGLPPGEGAFLACSFWLVDAYVMLGRLDDAQALFKRLAALCNDVGLLSEEYDPQSKELLGNFPRAVCSAQQLKDLHLAIRQPLNSLTRRGWFFTQCPLNYRCGDALTEIQLAREDLARCSQYLIGGVFFHDITGGARASDWDIRHNPGSPGSGSRIALWCHRRNRTAGRQALAYAALQATS